MRAALWVAAMAIAAPALADSTFYTSMLRRGIADYEQGQYVKATRELQLGAFGLLDDIPAYETAQMYLVMASTKLQKSEDARAAATRFVNAERVVASYRGIVVDASLRREFEQALPHLLTNSQLASVASLAPIVIRGAKSWSEVGDFYSDIRTRRRLSLDETATLFVALVESGRLADAAGMRPILPAAVSSSPAIAQQIARVAAPTTPSPMASASNGMTASEITLQLRDANKAIAEARFGEARQIFVRLSQNLTNRRDLDLEIARGLHRTSAFRESTAVYQRFYPLRRGEEQHMFTEAVNRYELGDVNTARTLLRTALPALASLPELALYRGRIERGS